MMADLARFSCQERDERRKRLKRERPDDRPVHVSQPVAYDQFYHTKNVKTYDKSRLPPGKFFCFVLFIFFRGPRGGGGRGWDLHRVNCQQCNSTVQFGGIVLCPRVILSFFWALEFLGNLYSLPLPLSLSLSLIDDKILRRGDLLCTQFIWFWTTQTTILRIQF